ncbi:unnamed protein product [Gadus morhua 'NCC']
MFLISIVIIILILIILALIILILIILALIRARGEQLNRDLRPGSARANQHECYRRASALRSAVIYHPDLSADVDPNRLTVQVLSGRGINEQMWRCLIWEDYRGLDP